MQIYARFIYSSFISKQFVKSLLACWGLLWGATEGVIYLWGHFSPGTIEKSYKLVVVELIISLIYALVDSWPFKDLSCTIPGTDTRIIVRFGDFWKGKGDYIIAVTRTFTMQADDVVISKKSLHGQYVQKAYPNWAEAQRTISAEIQRISLANGHGKYDFGATIFIPHNSTPAHLVALTDLDQNNRASVSLAQYFSAIANLWNSIAANNSGADIICPIIGSGLSRLQIKKNILLANLIKTAATISRQHKVANKIIFTIRREDVINGDISIDDIKCILEATEANIKFSSPIASSTPSPSVPTP